MIRIITPLAASLLPLSLAWGAAGISVNDSSVDGYLAEPMLPRCELRADDSGENIVLEGFVFARKPVSGSYQLRVSQRGTGGSSDIVQSGEFNIESDSTGSLGIVSLSKGTSRYEAKLEVQWDEGAPDCMAGAPKRVKQRLLKQNNESPGDMNGHRATGSALVQSAHANVDPTAAPSL